MSRQLRVPLGLVPLPADPGINLLNANQSQFDNDVADWSPTNATLSRSTAIRLDPTASMEINALSATTYTFVQTSDFFAAAPGDVINLVASFRPQSSTRSVYSQIRWYNSSFSQLGVLDGTQMTERAADWVDPFVTTTLPASTAWLQPYLVVLNVGAANEKHNIDRVGLFKGAICKTGDMYWNSTDRKIRVFNGVAWADAGAGSSGGSDTFAFFAG